MKLLHVSEYCHAGSVGGTERYLLDLIHGLKPHGIESQIGWLSSNQAGPFECDGVRISPLPASGMRVDLPPASLVQAAGALLDEYAPDAVHFHTFGLAEAVVAQVAKERGKPYVFTYHSPAWTCRREDLLIWGGQQPCNGEVRTLRCSACKVQERFGGPAVGGYLGALLSLPLGWVFSGSKHANLRRRVCFVSDTRRFRGVLKQFLRDCSLAVSCSEWGRPILTANGAAAARVTVLPQGVPRDFADIARSATGDTAVRQSAERPFTVGYVGRVTPVKGVDILAEGFSRVLGNDIRLKVYGFDASQASTRKLNSKLATLAGQDPRIELHPKLPLNEMAQMYRAMDLLAIPSVWLETGPLVLFEALQMGVPVFGSDRLGHPALLQAGGHVVTANTPAGWQQALIAALAEFRSGQWEQRRERIRTTVHLRQMDEVASEMAALYGRLSR